MKVKFLSILLFVSIYLNAQTNFTIDVAPILENYTYGELELKAIPFGMDEEISVGKIQTDGTIVFNWPTVNTDSLGESAKAYFFGEINVPFYCKKEQLEQRTEDCSVGISEYIHLYRDNIRVGILFATTDKEMLKNQPSSVYTPLTLGTSLSWYYSEGDCSLKGVCSEKLEWEGKYNYTHQITYDIHLKKGWNLVAYTLAEVEKYTDDIGQGNGIKKEIEKTVQQLPENIKWHIKAFMKLD